MKNQQTINQSRYLSNIPMPLTIYVNKISRHSFLFTNYLLYSLINFYKMNLSPLDIAALEAEYNVIVETLKKTRFNKSKAAELLQIDRKTLYNKIDAYEKLIAPTKAKRESISETY